jgi:hypothetical protein
VHADLLELELLELDEQRTLLLRAQEAGAIDEAGGC